MTDHDQCVKLKQYLSLSWGENWVNTNWCDKLACTPSNPKQMKNCRQCVTQFKLLFGEDEFNRQIAAATTVPTVRCLNPVPINEAPRWKVLNSDGYPYQFSCSYWLNWSLTTYCSFILFIILFILYAYFYIVFIEGMFVQKNRNKMQHRVQASGIGKQ